METTTKPDAGPVSSNLTNGALMVLALAAGAGVAYFANSNRGAHGDSDLRKRAVSALDSGEDAIDRLRSEFRQRARSIAEKTRSHVSSDFPSDAQLVERVRTHVANLVADAREIAVIARGGVIQLIGSILYEERDRLLAAVRAIPGIREVVDGLQSHLSAENGDAGRRPSRPLLAGSVGTALLALGLAKRGRAIPAAFLGAGLLAGSLAQSPRRR